MGAAKRTVPVHASPVPGPFSHPHGNENSPLHGELDDQFRETCDYRTGWMVERMGCWRIPRCGRRNEELYHGWRRAVELAMGDEEIATLTTLSRSRTELASRVSRAQILLAYRENPSFCAVGQRLGVHHQTVQRCVERALADGPLAALDDRPRPGKEPTITPEAKAWLISAETICILQEGSMRSFAFSALAVASSSSGS